MENLHFILHWYQVYSVVKLTCITYNLWGISPLTPFQGFILRGGGTLLNISKLRSQLLSLPLLPIKSIQRWQVFTQPLKLICIVITFVFKTPKSLAWLSEIRDHNLGFLLIEGNFLVFCPLLNFLQIFLGFQIICWDDLIADWEVRWPCDSTFWASICLIVMIPANFSHVSSYASKFQMVAGICS